MQKLVALLLIAVLAGSVTIPNVFSDNEKNTNENDNNQNQASAQENENDDKDNKTKMSGFPTGTSFTVTLPNGTKLTFGFSNGTNPGQQISAFIHKIRDAFKQQETLAKQKIKDCREKARDATNPADKKAIMNQCKIELKQVNQQFKSEHKQLQLDFKQFKETVIGNNQENHEKPAKENGAKIKDTALVMPSHGMNEKQKHANQNGKQKHGKE